MAASLIFLKSGSSWTVPPACYTVKAMCIGAGAGASGNGGDYAEALVSVIPGTTITYHIGSDGGATWFAGSSASNAAACARGGDRDVSNRGSLSYAGGNKNMPKGGGAAGPFGAGSGTSADAGHGGDEGGNDNYGTDGQEWTSTADGTKAGGGGGGGQYNRGIQTYGAPGGKYGGGGGIGNYGSGNGAPGIVALSFSTVISGMMMAA